MTKQLKNETPEEVSTEIVPVKNALVKQTADIDGFIEKRQEFIQKVGAICVEGKDYHIIQGKKSLAKGGAEKIASIFQWNSTFVKDNESIEMLGDIKGLVAFKCTLAKGNKFVGEGRGASTLQKNAGDPNKTLKMAQKSAFIDAVLRASGLSDFFTQDLEDMNSNDIGQPKTTQSFPPSEKQLATIQKNMVEKGITEEMIYDQGFDLKNLTGGKDGTASELIGWLFAQKRPEYDYDRGAGQITKDDKVVKLYTTDLEKCQTMEEFEQICGDIKIGIENGKISDNARKQLHKTAAVIKSQLEVKEIADGIPFK